MDHHRAAGGRRAAAEIATDAAAAFGLDLEGDTFRRINKMLFAQHVIAAKRQIENVRQTARNDAMMTAGQEPGATNTAAAEAETKAASGAVAGTESAMPDVFAAKVVTVAGRSLRMSASAHFRCRTTSPSSAEFIRLIELPEMPKDGLIIPMCAETATG